MDPSAVLHGNVLGFARVGAVPATSSRDRRASERVPDWPPSRYPSNVWLVPICLAWSGSAPASCGNEREQDRVPIHSQLLSEPSRDCCFGFLCLPAAPSN